MPFTKDHGRQVGRPLLDAVAQMLVQETPANPINSVPHFHCPTIAPASSEDLLIAWYAYPEDETQSGILVFTRKRPGTRRLDRSRRVLVGDGA